MDKPLNSKIAIVGLGYVGLPLSLQFARSGVPVLGFDIDPNKVDALNEGRSYIKHVPGAVVAEQVQAGRLAATTDFARVKEVDGQVKRGFAVFVGGGLGTIPFQAKLLNSFVTEDEILPLAQAIARVFARLRLRPARRIRLSMERELVESRNQPRTALIVH